MLSKNSKVAYILLAVLLVLLAALYVLYTLSNTLKGGGAKEDIATPFVEEPDAEQDEAAIRVDTGTATSAPVVLAEALTIPWDIALLPDGTMLVTERPGRVLHIESGQVFAIQGVEHVGEGGLLGIALHPDFSENRYVYLYQTTQTQTGLQNRVVRYIYDGERNALTFDRVIFSGIPGASYHDGGRIAFGPDGLLYVTTGDAGNEAAAQDRTSLAGKILRLTDEGEVAEGNPFGTAIFSYGHRNPQGLAWDDQGRLWSTEHGRSGLRSGFDEINLIEAGKNYGWPQSQGDTVLRDAVAPVRHSGADTTWAPASALYLPARLPVQDTQTGAEHAGEDGSILFGGLRGETLYEAVMQNGEVIEIREHFKGEFGRIRSVVLGPDGNIYLTTSNRDGRGDPAEGDDRIIQIDPAQFRE